MVAARDILARLRAAGVTVSLRAGGKFATRGTVPVNLVAVATGLRAEILVELKAELRAALTAAGDDPALIVDVLAAAGLPLRLAPDGCSPVAPAGTPESALKVLRRHRDAVLVELRQRGIRAWLGDVAGNAWSRLREALGAEHAHNLDDVLGDLVDNPAVSDRHDLADGLWSRIAGECAEGRIEDARGLIDRAHEASVRCDLAVLRVLAVPM